MATTTPNFGWQVPTSTDYVKDGAVAIETLGDAIDASLVDLKGGTTGQVLSKNTNTDMDFVWVTPDDADAIQNTIVDAKGDLIAATAADTPARLAVGANGQVLTADSTTATGLKWATASSGGMTLIATATPSAATTVSFTSIPTTYKTLMVVWWGVYQSSSTTYFQVRLNNNTGSIYTYQTVAANPNGTVFPFQGANAGTSFGGNELSAPISYTTTSSTSYFQQSHGRFEIFNADSTTLEKPVEYANTGQTLTGADSSTLFGRGLFRSTTAISQIDFIRSSTQTITGNFALYGIS